MDRLLEISILIGSIFSCSRCHPSETSTAKGFSFQDNKYPATVKYNNPQTGCTATYLLDLEVKNCMVVQINFPNGGHLDNDHVKATLIDKKGYANVIGKKTKHIWLELIYKKKGFNRLNVNHENKTHPFYYSYCINNSLQSNHSI